MGQAGQLGLWHRLGEALDGVVAGMNLHQQGGARADGGGEVPPMGAVGGADFDEPGAGAAHDVGDAEGAADLDEFAPGDDDLFLARQGIEQQEDAGGIVVDHRGGLDAGEFPHQFGNQVVTVTAPPGIQVIFQGAGLAGGGDQGLDGLFRQGCPAQVGMQHGTGEVEYGPQARGQPPGEAGGELGDQAGLVH